MSGREVEAPASLLVPGEALPRASESAGGGSPGLAMSTSGQPMSVREARLRGSIIVAAEHVPRLR